MTFALDERGARSRAVYAGRSNGTSDRGALASAEPGPKATAPRRRAVPAWPANWRGLFGGILSLSLVLAPSDARAGQARTRTARVTVAHENEQGTRTIDMGTGPLSIAGKVIGSNGAIPRDVDVRLIYEERGTTGGSAGIPLAEDGTFTFHGLSAGPYVLEARPSEAAPGVPRLKGEYGYSVVRLDDRDIADVTIVTAPAASLSGVVRLETTDPLSRPSARCGDGSFPVRTVMAVLVDGPALISSAATAVVRPDGTFVFPGIGGPRVIRLGAICDTVRLNRVLLDGADVTNEPFDVGKAPPGPLTVVVSNDAKPLLVRVVDDDGNRAADAWVAMLAADPGQRTMPPDVNVMHVTGQHGRAAFMLPAGEYLAIALPVSEAPTVSSVLDRLRELEDRATRVVVPRTQPLDLRLIR